ncbi:unnamed protein product, partial [Effrenium voratum]
VAAFCEAYSASFKAANEEEKVTDAFVDTAITMGYDGWKNGHLGADMLTWRAFNGTLNGKGTVDICIALMHWLCGYRGQKLDLTWRAGWPRSAEFFFQFLEDDGQYEKEEDSKQKKAQGSKADSALRERLASEDNTKKLDNASKMADVLAATAFADWMYVLTSSTEEDNLKSWRLPFSDKKALFGKANRVPVGGKPDAADETEKGQDCPLLPPVAPPQLNPVARHPVEEIYEEFNIGGVLDLAPSDKFAFCAIAKRVPYVGVAFTVVALLTKRLEYLTFRAMQLSDSPLYEPGLAALLHPKRKNKKACGLT